ncbi:MAG: aa3-type cytochrome c oxidase subunit IV [Devosia sp.]
MAGDSANGTNVDNGEPPQTDIAEHQKTFDRLISLTKWAIIVVAVILIGLAYFLL